MSQTAICGHVRMLCGYMRMREKKSTRIIPTKILHGYNITPLEVQFIGAIFPMFSQ